MSATPDGYAAHERGFVARVVAATNPVAEPPLGALSTKQRKRFDALRDALREKLGG